MDIKKKEVNTYKFIRVCAHLSHLMLDLHALIPYSIVLSAFVHIHTDTHTRRIFCR